MNAGELIALLSTFDPALPVLFPNLDCTDVLHVTNVLPATIRTRPSNRFNGDTAQRHEEAEHVETGHRQAEFGPEWPALLID